MIKVTKTLYFTYLPRSSREGIDIVCIVQKISVIAGATGPVGDTGSTATTGPAHTG